MSLTNFLIVPSVLAGEPLVCKSGNTYQAVNNIVTNVASGDLLDVINMGCRQVGGPDAGANLPLVAGRFYGVPRGATPGTVLSVTNLIYAYPIRLAGNVPIQTIGMNTTTGQTGGAFHAGIYTDLNGAPNALVPGSDTGAQIATSGAAVQTFTPVTPITLNDGWYWLASAFTASGTYPTMASVATGYASELNADQGSDTALHLSAASVEATTGVTATFTYGALPAAFPTAGYALQLNAGVPLVILGT